VASRIVDGEPNVSRNSQHHQCSFYLSESSAPGRHACSRRPNCKMTLPCSKVPTIECANPCLVAFPRRAASSQTATTSVARPRSLELEQKVPALEFSTRCYRYGGSDSAQARGSRFCHDLVAWWVVGRLIARSNGMVKSRSCCCCYTQRRLTECQC
jgi:hypothetical protein